MMNLEGAVLPIRGTQAVFSIIVFGFTTYVANWWNKYWRDMSPSEINFLLFCSVWSILSLVYLTMCSMPSANTSRLRNKWAELALDAVNTTFWFAGFIALAVFLGSRVCFGTVCGVAKASVAFAAFQWLLFGSTTLFGALLAFRAARGAADESHIKEFQQDRPVQMKKQQPQVDPSV